MKRVKTLGLATALALALTAATAGSASAAGIVADASPAMIEGKPSQLILMGEFGESACSAGSPLSKTISTPVEALVTTAGNAKSCEKAGNELHTNGCGITLHPGAEKSPGVFSGTFDIGPVGCGPMTVAFGLYVSCNVQIGAQTGLPATFENIGSGSTADVRVKAEAVNTLKYTTVSGNCRSLGTFNGGTYTTTWLLEATSVTGASTGLHVDGKYQKGIYTTAGGFTADAYPAPFAGNQNAGEQHVAQLMGLPFSCGTAQFSGTLTGLSTQLTANATYSSCKWSEYYALVKMNSCSYTFHTTNGMGVSCKKAGEKIEITAYLFANYTYPLCTASIAAQSGHKEVKYTNVGSGTGRGIDLDMNVSGLEYSTQGPYCETKSYSDGTYVGGSTLLAS